MRVGLKEEILETARRLFAEQGYNSVSMRDIAGTLGISVGNLTYYFKKKEDLIEAAILDRAQNPIIFIQPKDLTQLNELFWELYENQMNNTYYFRHYTQLAQISPRVYQIQKERIRQHIELLENAFSSLRQQNLMEPEMYDGQTAVFIQGLLSITQAWMPRQLMQDQPFAPSDINLVDRLWGMMYYALTDTGKQFFLTTLLPANRQRKSQTDPAS